MEGCKMDDELGEFRGESEGTYRPKMEGRREALSIGGGGPRMDVEDTKG